LSAANKFIQPRTQNQELKKVVLQNQPETEQAKKCLSIQPVTETQKVEQAGFPKSLEVDVEEPACLF
jgi:hypothetical protein